MLADKIKERIEAQKNSDIEKLDKENQVKRAEEEKKLQLLVKLFDALKKEINLISEGKKNLIVNKNGSIKLTDSRKIFGEHFYDQNIVTSTIHDSGRDLNDILKNTKYKSTLESFNTWLKDNGFKRIIVSFEHCGGGMRSWNGYSAEFL